MSTKTTIQMTRAEALDLLAAELADTSNNMLADILDNLAENGHSKRLSRFNDFLVTDYNAF